MPDCTLNGYVVEHVLGTGSFGEVLLVTKVRSSNNNDYNNNYRDDSINIGRQLVIKKIPNDRMKMCEVEAGRILSHPNIVTFYEHFQDKDFHYLVLEYVRGIDLFTFMESRNFQGLPEVVARKIFGQIASAIQYCHQEGVAHRDLKLENILIDPKTLHVKIIDFELCKIGDEACSDVCGSVDYIAPEILQEKPHYSPKKADIWCLGTILYCLLFANFPFSAEERLNALIPEGGQPVMPHPLLEFPKKSLVSQNARDLCERAMTVDPNRRISMPGIMAHGWMLGQDINTASSDRNTATITKVRQYVTAVKARTRGEEMEESPRPTSDTDSSSHCTKQLVETAPTPTASNNFIDIVDQICRSFEASKFVSTTPSSPTTPATTATTSTTSSAPVTIPAHNNDSVQRDCGREVQGCLQGCGGDNSSRCQHFAVVRSPV